MKNELTAKRLSMALNNANMKPQELADKSGVSKSSISQYINGSHAPSNISSGKMAKILNVNPLWLMGFDVTPDYIIFDESNNPILIETKPINRDIHSQSDIYKLLVNYYGSAAECMIMFSKLDLEDRAEIKGEMKQMLKADKYQTKDIYKNA